MKTKSTMKPVISFMLVLALVLTMAMAPIPAYAAVADHDRISIATGEPVEIEWNVSTPTIGAVVTNTSINYYPSTFVLYADNTVTAPSISNGGDVKFLYNTSGGDAYQIELPNMASTITVELANPEIGDGIYTLICQAPQGVAPGGSTPAYVNGYLPVGQFATGQTWGSIFSNGTNLTGTTVKFLSGYQSTGVSLGAGGGYVQFEFDNVIENKATNPYGIDFIIYGNAFNGNPEAGAVKVSTDGALWYDLAGSLYYDAKSKNNVDVSYKKVTTTSGAFPTAGIYYKMGTGSWTKFNTNTSVAWWPENDTEGYGTVSGISAEFKGSTVTVEGVEWDSPYDEITYEDISLVKDTDNTNDYQFGYFDVRANGSNYGTAVNPYATLPTANNGGDGFDISWAVDQNGEPVALNAIKYVRAYTTATLNTTGDAFTVPSIFGETSAEVCGIYTALGTGDGVATTAPAVSFGRTTGTMGVISTSHMGVTPLTFSPGTTCYISVTSAADNIYVNGTAVTSGTNIQFTVPVGTSKRVQIITQDGDEAPYVTVLRITR